MKAIALPCLLSFSLTAIASITCYAQTGPCDVITKAEAEAVVGVPLQSGQLTPGKTLCRFLEPGAELDAPGRKQMTIGMFRSPTPHSDDVNNRRQAISQDKSLPNVVLTNVTNLGDQALWV
jgi:hypothetical protein